MIRPKSLFGRPPDKPDYGLDDAVGATDEASPVDHDGAQAEEDLQHTGMGSLAGISIHRRTRGGAAPAMPAAAATAAAHVDPRNISEYWSRLRKGRRWPAKADIDTKLVSIKWRNCLLMVVGERGTPWRFESLAPGVMRGGGLSLTDNDIDFNHLVMEWILALGRTAKEVGQPVENSDVFPGDDGEIRYRAVAVPLGDDDKSVTHVLCHIARI